MDGSSYKIRFYNVTKVKASFLLGYNELTTYICTFIDSVHSVEKKATEKAAAKLLFRRHFESFSSNSRRLDSSWHPLLSRLSSTAFLFFFLFPLRFLYRFIILLFSFQLFFIAPQTKGILEKGYTMIKISLPFSFIFQLPHVHLLNLPFRWF